MRKLQREVFTGESRVMTRERDGCSEEKEQWLPRI